MSDEILFPKREDFRSWLYTNAKCSKAIWLVIGKKGIIKTISAAEALEEALCFGWIDGKIKRVDELKYIKYFAPRREESKWSEKNKKAIPGLIKKGLMTDLGIESINTAKKNGCWNTDIVKINLEEKIKEFQSLITKHKTAFNNFNKATTSFKKQIVSFYFDAKQEVTRNKRLSKIVNVLVEDKKQILY